MGCVKPKILCLFRYYSVLYCINALIHVHHAIEECPEEHVGAKAAHELIGQQISAVNEKLAPLGARFHEHQNPEHEHGQEVEEESQRTTQAQNTCELVGH